MPDRVREQIAPLMADAFGATFWWALGLLVLAFLAAFLLPFHRTEALDEPAEGQEAQAAPVVIPA